MYFCVFIIFRRDDEWGSVRWKGNVWREWSSIGDLTPERRQKAIFALETNRPLTKQQYKVATRCGKEILFLCE